MHMRMICLGLCACMSAHDVYYDAIYNDLLDCVDRMRVWVCVLFLPLRRPHPKGVGAAASPPPLILRAAARTGPASGECHLEPNL